MLQITMRKRTNNNMHFAENYGKLTLDSVHRFVLEQLVAIIASSKLLMATFYLIWWHATAWLILYTILLKTHENGNDAMQHSCWKKQFNHIEESMTQEPIAQYISKTRYLFICFGIWHWLDQALSVRVSSFNTWLVELAFSDSNSESKPP